MTLVTKSAMLPGSSIEHRQAICIENELGLTDFYNQVDDGAWSEISNLHRQLDETVTRAYGWKPTIAHDPVEIKARLAELHASISSEAQYDPFR